MKTQDADVSEQSQRDLAAGVLKQATQDLRRFHRQTSGIERELYHDAYSWVMSDDFSWPFSFQNVCRLLNRAPDELRRELIGDLAFGPFDQWTRRCSRAIRRSLNSLTQRFATEHNVRTAIPARLIQTWHQYGDVTLLQQLATASRLSPLNPQAVNYEVAPRSVVVLEST